VHVVRARPLQTIKNNIEPDEHREEADTIPARGVNPEPPPPPPPANAPPYIISPHKGA